MKYNLFALNKFVSADAYFDDFQINLNGLNTCSKIFLEIEIICLLYTSLMSFLSPFFAFSLF